MLLKAVRGMNDILPDEVSRWQHLEATLRAHVERYGYAEVRTPLIERTELFVKQVGEGTDIVDKEMYSFERHDDRLTVRPEGTAGAARAYVEHSVFAKEPASRWYYLGAMFRGERPAKGRYRQFYQAGCEHFGDPGPLADAEMIELATGLLSALGIRGFKVHLNTLGSGDARARYRDALVAYLEPQRARLSEDSQRRLERNPLRVLDSKDPADAEVIAGAPSILDVVSAEDRAHFDAVRGLLEELEVPFEIDPRLVRGLDYYTRTLFEIRATSGSLGAQSALAGGGRYDGMVEGLGGPSVPAIGFALGLERILLESDLSPPGRELGCYLAPMTEAAGGPAARLARDLRALGVRTLLDGRPGRLKAKLSRASRLEARLCVILGEDELARGVAAVKDLAGRAQEDVALSGAAARIAEKLAAAPGAGDPEPGGDADPGAPRSGR